MSAADKIAEARALIENPEMIRCNQCGGLWVEDDLPASTDAAGDGWSHPCPSCGTDHYLTDVSLAGSAARLVDLAEAQAQEIARLRWALEDGKAALIEVKREMWRQAQPNWTMADFLNWAMIQQITTAISRARAALGDTP